MPGGNLSLEACVSTIRDNFDHARRGVKALRRKQTTSARSRILKTCLETKLDARERGTPGWAGLPPDGLTAPGG